MLESLGDFAQGLGELFGLRLSRDFPHLFFSRSLAFGALGIWRATGTGAVFSPRPLLRSTLSGDARRAGKSLLDWKLVHSNTHVVIHSVLGGVLVFVLGGVLAL